MSERALGTEPEPGLYRWRSSKGAPWRPVRITRQNGTWIVLIAGVLVKGSGLYEDPLMIAFLLHSWPLHPIDEAEYDRLMTEYEGAPSGHPLHTPDQKVSMRDWE